MSLRRSVARAWWLYRYSRLGEGEKVRMFGLGATGERRGPGGGQRPAEGRR